MKNSKRVNNNQQQKKRTCRIVDFADPADHRVKLKEIEKRDKYLNLTMEHENDDETNYNWCSQYSHQKFDTRTGGLGNNGTGGDWPNYSIVEIGQNTEKSPGDLRRHAVTQTPEENHQLTLKWKLSTSKIIIIMIIIIIIIIMIIQTATWKKQTRRETILGPCRRTKK